MPATSTQTASTTKTAVLAGLGAALCISLLSGLESLFYSGFWLMAPFGATMVIAFALPDSPLAQPKNIVLGHLLTSFIGLLILSLLGVTALSMGLAVGLAVTLMMLTKTTHPPAGANPLLIMLTAQQWPFLITPVLTGTLLIVAVVWLYHRLVTGKAYPKIWF